MNDTYKQAMNEMKQIETVFYPGWCKKAITFTIDDGNFEMDRKLLDIVRPAVIYGTFSLCSNHIDEKMAEQPQAVETKETEQPAKKKKNHKAKKTETVTAEPLAENPIEHEEATQKDTEPTNQADKQPKSKKRGRPKKHFN